MDSCCLVVHGRVTFPFASELFNLFFEFFLSTRPRLLCGLPPRPRTMHICACEGSCYPRMGSQSDHVVRSTDTIMISWLEWTIMSSILYYTHMQGWIGEDVWTPILLRTIHKMIEIILSLCFDKTSCIFFCSI